MTLTGTGYKPREVLPASPYEASVLRAAATGDTVRPDVYLPTLPREVRAQEATQTCVSCAVTAAMECRNPGYPALSPLFHYYATRYDRNLSAPSGELSLDDGVVTLTTHGVCRLESHRVPFTDAGASTRPTSEAYADAMERRVGRVGKLFKYRRLIGPSFSMEIREELNRGNPVAVGLWLPAGYPAGIVGAERAWMDPAAPAPSHSGHCVAAIGFSDARNAICVQDSQGASRFDKGRWWLGYRVADSGAVAEAFALL